MICHEAGHKCQMFWYFHMQREAAERKMLEEDYHNLKQRMEAAKARYTFPKKS